jgi:hypothetical protein
VFHVLGAQLAKIVEKSFGYVGYRLLGVHIRAATPANKEAPIDETRHDLK